MKITILGWYGTETLGDRAILAGILSDFSELFPTITIGSLFPFFTERTVKEDFAFYKKYMDFNNSIDIIDSNSPSQLRQNIESSDLVIVGGGPLMDIDNMHMLSYGLKYAKKKGVKTLLFGCGVGPLNKKEFKKAFIKIYHHSDLVILRDNISKYNAEVIFDEFKYKNSKKIYISYDPSVLALLKYKKKSRYKDKNNHLILNLREFPMVYSSEAATVSNVQSKIEKILKYLSSHFINTDTILLPNHYFFWGGDDREIMSRLLFENNKFSKFRIQQSPLNLEETFELYSKAKYCIGMRFHSIVFQTLLNGNNFVLDYTHPQKGKIVGFLKDIQFDFKRYISLHTKAFEITKINILKELKTVDIFLDKKKFEKYKVLVNHLFDL